jgi:hypothetical protein
VSSSITIGRPGQFDQFEAHCRKVMEGALLRASDRASKAAVTEIRAAMRGAGLGRLANAIGAGSDASKGRGVHPTPGGFSASGWVHIRGRSERTRGALEAYTEGATITAKRVRWLAIATDQIPRRAGRQKMTPQLYVETGLAAKIGPLQFVQGRNAGEALLIVRDVTVDKFGRKGRYARRLPKRGAIGSSRQRADSVVAFVLIRDTTRGKRVDPTTIIAANAARLPALVAEEMRKES